MLPGKTYKPEDILKVIRKRFWVVVVPWAVVAAVTAAVARKLPDLYESKAMIQVIPPQVPGNIVAPSTTVSLQQRLQATTQTILSRTRLERLIQDFDLYRPEREKRQIMEDIVEGMRSDIHVDPVKGDAFTVRYVGRNPTTVMKVTEQLASFFKEENAKEGERRAQDTSSFVESAVDEAKRKLVATEDRLKQYRIAHAGELPDQLGANMQAVQTINQQLATLAQEMNNENNAKISLERRISDLEEQGNTATATADPMGTAAQRLAAARNELRIAVESRGWKPDNPDRRRLEATVKSLEIEANAEALKAPVTAANPAEQNRLARLAAAKEDLDRLKQSVEQGKQTEKQLRSNLAVYQSRIDKIPVRDAELIELNRDYDTLNKLYTDLVAAREKSNMSVNAERRQIGEQFVLLDAARVPERPVSPNRPLINLFGLLSGLGVGVALAALLEYRDSTFKTDSEIASALALPVLAVVPIMKAEPERRADFRRTLMLNMGLASVVLVCLAVLTYTFVR